MSAVCGDSESANMLLKLILTGIVPCCGHCLSQEQRTKLWMTKVVRTEISVNPTT